MSPWRAAYSAAVFLALPFAILRIIRRAKSAQAPLPFREYFGKIPLPPSLTLPPRKQR